MELPAQGKPFRPWHLPRKHYVRIHQWCAEIKDLTRHLKAAGALNFRPLAYLSLPGDELLDIRTIHGVCDSQGVRLSYLGFNTTGDGARADESRISENEVKALPRVYAQGSMVLNDALENVANEKSLARRRVLENGSFDVINLDLCGSVANQPPLTVGSTLEAVRALLEIQRSRRVEPWLLFLTTRVDTEVLDREVRARLRALTKKNAHSSADFKVALQACLEMEVDRMLELRDEELSQSVFAKLFGVGFGKWLLGLVLHSSPKWRIFVTSAFGYRVDRAPLDMLSLGFRFELIREPASDPAGLTLGAGSSVVLDSEESLAAGMAVAMGGVVDVDEVLYSDGRAREKIMNQFARLLGQARYGVDAYVAWVDGEHRDRGLIP
ncbi:MAG: hypothetical protein EOP84_02960 [Verrucomicrobiaceae bacterium]|nr:MAG: hypothetical protein EOP84_02960 [Verrucomicrobiaceae bacterium]